MHEGRDHDTAPQQKKHGGTDHAAGRAAAKESGTRLAVHDTVIDRGNESAEIVFAAPFADESFSEVN